MSVCRERAEYAVYNLKKTRVRMEGGQTRHLSPPIPRYTRSQRHLLVCSPIYVCENLSGVNTNIATYKKLDKNIFGTGIYAYIHTYIKWFCSAE